MLGTLERIHVLRQTEDWVLWRGEDPADRSRYIVKELRPEWRGDRTLTERFAAEYRLAARCVNEHLLRAIRLSEDGAAIVYEDAQCTLGQLLRQTGPLDVDLAVNVLHCALRGLEVLHECSLGVGTVNTETLLVDPRGRLKIGGFLAYEFHKETPVPESNLKYQAPEVIRSTLGRLGPSSDLYCLGFAALEMLVGAEFDQLFASSQAIGPEERPNWLAWHADLGKQLENWRDSAPQVPTALAAILDGLMVKPPAERRYRSARQLLAELSGFQMESKRGLPTYRMKGSDGKRPRSSKPAPASIATPQPLSLTREADGMIRRFRPDRAILLGKQGECDLQVQSSRASSKHALLVCIGDAWQLHDLHSTSGSYVNGRLVQQATLASGDTVTIGHDRFSVAIGADAATVQIGEFQLLKILHRGGRSGDLYKAIWTADKRQRIVALRIYPKEFCTDEKQLRRFLRGIPKAAEFRHPHILRLHRGGVPSGAGKGRLWLAMDYAPGGSLRDLLAEKEAPLSVAAVLRFGGEICSALTAAAENGLIHRNINPSCILFGEEGDAKLGDFSLLRELTDEAALDMSASGVQIADYLYRAPEQLNGAKSLDATCDVYSLAATMYEALAGRPAFGGGDDLPAMFQAVVTQPPSSLRRQNPKVSDELERILFKALAKDPKRRYRSAQDFALALNSLEARGSMNMRAASQEPRAAAALQLL